jgi:hypothetical protein
LQGRLIVCYDEATFCVVLFGAPCVTHPATPTLANKCQNETDNFLNQRQYDPQYCYELFVRAFRYNDNAAFDQLLTVYHGLVIHWAKRHSPFTAVKAEREEITHYAFIKMWRSTRGERFTFDSLPAILGYLRDCINAALWEMHRDFAATSKEQGVDKPMVTEIQLEGTPDFELLWQQICIVLPERELQNIVWYSFVHGYKPEALLAEFPADYPDKDTIRVLKQKAMRRLRKDPMLRRWFGLPSDEL